jgi:hypothetical protein
VDERTNDPEAWLTELLLEEFFPGNSDPDSNRVAAEMHALAVARTIISRMAYTRPPIPLCVMARSDMEKIYDDLTIINSNINHSHTIKNTLENIIEKIHTNISETDI